MYNNELFEDLDIIYKVVVQYDNINSHRITLLKINNRRKELMNITTGVE